MALPDLSHRLHVRADHGVHVELDHAFHAQAMCSEADVLGLVEGVYASWRWVVLPGLPSTTADRSFRWRHVAIHVHGQVRVGRLHSTERDHSELGMLSFLTALSLVPMTQAVNAFLFRGEARGYWRLLARGADRASIVHRRHGGHRYDFGIDSAGLARRSGGIVKPEERSLGGGKWLYRFVDSRSYSKPGRDTVYGNWWVDQDTWQLLAQASREHGQSLQQVAQNYLALPDEWGDRMRIALGRLVNAIQVWTGHGEVAIDSRGGAHTPAQHNKAVQLFVPGQPDLVAKAFGGRDLVECVYARDVKSGW